MSFQAVLSDSIAAAISLEFLCNPFPAVIFAATTPVYPRHS